jgi:hypothetical protein
MRRVFLIAVLAVLMPDASGLSSLLVPETCPIGASESAPDSGCPAFCVRCTCACCAASIEGTPAINVVATALPPATVQPLSTGALPHGSTADILHIPKTLLT